MVSQKARQGTKNDSRKYYLSSSYNRYDLVQKYTFPEAPKVVYDPILKDRCFHLSVDDCDCDVVFYCKLLCEPQESSYDSSTETCCCLE